MRAVALAALLAGCAAAPAGAAVDWSGEVALVSDQRDRGLSLSRHHAALQAVLLAEHGSGVYAEVWASTLGHRLETEVDVTVGYYRPLGDLLSLDLSATYATYPGDSAFNFVEVTASLRAERDGKTLAAGASFAPAQRGTADEEGKRRGNLYVWAIGEVAVRGTPLTLVASGGYERGAFDAVERGGKWDWSAGARLKLAPFALGLRYVGSSARVGRGDALVGSVAVGF